MSGYLAVVLASACQVGAGTPCGDGYCGAGYECTVDDGERLCVLLERCGNGIPEHGESCDDGNEVSGDGCSGDCRSNETCGNGILDRDEDEHCDDGNALDGDDCPASCQYHCTTQETPEYLVCDDTLTWPGARDACQQLGGRLVTIDDDDENMFVASLVPVNYWIGLSDMAEEGTWRWVNGGVPPFTTWGSGEPNDDEGAEDCAEVRSQDYPYAWNDVDCATKHAFVCELGCTHGCVCGNEHVELGESCDDGNTIPGDGCDTACQIEPECGNELVESGETCDDGNAIPGDGCDGCQLETTLEIEPNEDGSVEINGPLTGNDFAAANANGPYTSSIIISATFEPAGDEDVFAVTNHGPGAAEVHFQTQDAVAGLGVPCDTLDTILVIRDSEGNELASGDDELGLCSRVSYAMEPGETVYAHVIEYLDDDVVPAPGYWLLIEFR